MAQAEMTRQEKIAFVRNVQHKYLRLQGKSAAELQMTRALTAAIDVLDLNDEDRSEIYNKGFTDGRIFEARQVEVARGDTEIVSKEDHETE